MFLDLLAKHRELTITATLILTVLVLYNLSVTIIKNTRLENDRKRKAILKIRTTLLFIVLVSSVTLWATQIYEVVISVAAILAAFAIAFKEVFLCFGGGFYRTFAHSFGMGDRIEINGIRGDVIDIGFMGTQLLEVGPKGYTHQYTGRTVSFPNSLILSSQILNESDNAHGATDFALHVFTVPIANTPDWKSHQEKLLAAANDACEHYIPEASKFFNRLARKRSVDSPWVEPRINIRFDTQYKLDLIVRVTVPIRIKGTVEQEILTSYLEKVHGSQSA